MRFCTSVQFVLPVSFMIDLHFRVSIGLLCGLCLVLHLFRRTCLGYLLGCLGHGFSVFFQVNIQLILILSILSRCALSNFRDFLPLRYVAGEVGFLISLWFVVYLLFLSTRLLHLWMVLSCKKRPFSRCYLSDLTCVLFCLYWVSAVLYFRFSVFMYSFYFVCLIF